VGGPIEHHSIDVPVEGADLVLDGVNGCDLGIEIRDSIEIRDGGVHSRLPGREIGGCLLHRLEALAEGVLQTIHARLDQREAIPQFLHLVEQELRIRIHSTERFLEAGTVVVMIQTEDRIESLIPDVSSTVAETRKENWNWGGIARIGD